MDKDQQDCIDADKNVIWFLILLMLSYFREILFRNSIESVFEFYSFYAVKCALINATS